MRQRAITGRVQILVAAFAVAAAVAGITVVIGTTPSAASAQRLHRGKGYAGNNGDFVGFYIASKATKVYCLSPRKGLPSRISLRTVHRFEGLGAAGSQQLAYALSTWGDAASAPAAAAESQLLNTIAGNRSDVARRARLLPKSIATVVRRHLALVRRYYGPYVTTVRLRHAVLPGQRSTGSVIVTSATGHRVPGVSVVLTTGGNAVVTHRITAGHRGIARFSYRVTNVGQVHIRAAVDDLAPTTLRANRPGAGQQHMVTWSRAVTSHAAASFARSPSGFSSRYACTSACAGHPDVIVTACAPASLVASRLTYTWGTRARAVTFAASRHRACQHVVLSTADGDHVRARWQFRTSRGWSRSIAASGDLVVDCPAVPAVGVTMSYDCTRATLTIGLAVPGAHGAWTPLTNATSRRLVLVVDGQQRRYANRGEQAVFTEVSRCGAHVRHMARAGIQRHDGSYNYGASVSITSP